MALVIKNPPASAGDIRDRGLISGSRRSSGGGIATTPVFLLGEPRGWREESGGLQSIGMQRIGHD